MQMCLYSDALIRRGVIMICEIGWVLHRKELALHKQTQLFLW